MGYAYFRLSLDNNKKNIQDFPKIALFPGFQSTIKNPMSSPFLFYWSAHLQLLQQVYSIKNMTQLSLKFKIKQGLKIGNIEPQKEAGDCFFPNPLTYHLPFYFFTRPILNFYYHALFQFNFKTTKGDFLFVLSSPINSQ